MEKLNEIQTLYLSANKNKSALLVNLTAPKKRSFTSKLAYKYCDHLSNSQMINKITTLFRVKVTLS